MAQSPDGSMGTPMAPGYIAASGTSFAAPIGAALAAMVLKPANFARRPPKCAKSSAAPAARRLAYVVIYLIAYDIASPRRLSRVARHLEKHELRPRSGYFWRT